MKIVIPLLVLAVSIGSPWAADPPAAAEWPRLLGIGPSPINNLTYKSGGQKVPDIIRLEFDWEEVR